MREHIGRDNPAKGVYIFRGQPTIVFLTVCALRREPVLVNFETHNALVHAWTEADAWRVGFYLIMPSHIHLFVHQQTKITRLRAGLSFGNVSFGAGPPLMRPDFNRAAFTIGFAATRTITRN
jgi:hypothetical protein